MHLSVNYVLLAISSLIEWCYTNSESVCWLSRMRGLSVDLNLNYKIIDGIAILSCQYFIPFKENTMIGEFKMKCCKILKLVTFRFE